MSNIFTEYQAQKDKLCLIISKAREYEWLNDEDANNLVNKLDNDILRIGVIGQMKCGKSTYLNSLIFGKDVLPSSATPMTAALSVVTYGETARIEVEFYSKDDWKEQIKLSQQQFDENSYDEFNLRIKSAKELVRYSARLGNSLDSLLGTRKQDSLENLEDYVGSKGKFVSIVKLVKIYYPLEYLKGVEIVDTPGFNDPIQSREARTSEFLKTADAVVMLIYAGKPFSLDDKSILFNNVRKCGIGKVVIGVNKYDIPYQQGDTMEKIAQDVRNAIRESAVEFKDYTIDEIVQSANLIPFSAEMALISQYPMSKILENNEHRTMWERCAVRDNRLFDNITSPQQLYELSNVKELNDSIMHLITQDKTLIRLKKIESVIVEKGNDILAQTIKDLEHKKHTLRLLNAPNEELEDMLHDLSTAKRTITRKIENLELDLEEYFSDFIQETGEELEDLFDNSCKKCIGFVDNIGFTESIDQLVNKIQIEFYGTDKSLTRKLNRSVKTLKENINIRIVEFLNSLSRTIGRALPDFDCDGFVNSLRKQLQITASFEDMFKEDENEDYTLLNFLGDIMSGFFEGYLNVLTLGYYERIQAKNKIREGINSLMAQFNIRPSLESTLKNKEDIIKQINQACFEDLINPIETMINNTNNDIDQKEEQIKTLTSDISSLELKKSRLEEEYDIVKSMVAECYLN